MNKNKVKFLGGGIACFVLSCVLLTGCGTNPPYSQADCVGKEAAAVETAFKDAGFTTVEVVETETTDAEKDGIVSKVEIDGWTSFKDSSACSSDDAVTITKYVIAYFEPTIEVETSGEVGWPEFTVKTNLPDKTELILTLSDDNYYTEQQTATVKNGEAKSKKFTEEKGLPLAGDYTLVVVMSTDEQKDKIKEQIGEHGETLTGELVETDETTGSSYIHYETTYHSPYTQGEIESALTPSMSLEEIAEIIEADLESALGDASYKVVPDSGGINITLAVDGIADVAAAAMLGDSDSLKIWNELTENAKAASKRYQVNYLDVAGYTDKLVVLNIATDMNTDKVLYQACSGMVLYDGVSKFGAD